MKFNSEQDINVHTSKCGITNCAIHHYKLNIKTKNIIIKVIEKSIYSQFRIVT